MIDYNKPWYWLNEYSELFLKRKYTKDDPKVHYRKLANKVEEVLGKKGISDKIYEYTSKNYYLFPTPFVTNFLDDKESAISCFGSVINDSVFDIMFTQAEVGMLSKMGGGTAAKILVREKGAKISKGGFAEGVMKVVYNLYEVVDFISQKSRRGVCAVYLDVTHPEFYEFMSLQDKSNKRKMFFGITFPKEFMDNLKTNKEYQKRWALCIKKKCETGFPYFFFDENVEKGKPEVYKDKDIKINNSQLCTEILLENNSETTYVCALLAMNVFHFDEYKDTDAIEVGVYIIDAMLTDFINKSKGNPLLQRAVKFATEQRAIGLGASGWHSYLQRNMIPLESMEAKYKNVEIFKDLQQKTHAASVKMASEYGKPLYLKDDKYNYRHVAKNAIAPNTSSSEIHGGLSQSIEPLYSNYYVSSKSGIKRIVKNTFLEDLLERKNKNTESVWESIKSKNGSVQHLEFLTEYEKRVFKTYYEISPMELIIQNAQRQKYIDQGISFNVMITSDVSPKDISNLYLKCYELGLKTTYYQLNQNATQEMLRQNILECESCAA